MSSLTIEAGKRRSSLEVRFENIRRSQNVNWEALQGLPGCGGVSMARRQGQGTGKGEGVRGPRLPSPPCFPKIYLCISTFCLDDEGCWRIFVLCTDIHEFLFISFYLFVCQKHVNVNFNILNFIIVWHVWALLYHLTKKMSGQIHAHDDDNCFYYYE